MIALTCAVPCLCIPREQNFKTEREKEIFLFLFVSLHRNPNNKHITVFILTESFLWIYTLHSSLSCTKLGLGSVWCIEYHMHMYVLFLQQACIWVCGVWTAVLLRTCGNFPRADDDVSASKFQRRTEQTKKNFRHLNLMYWWLRNEHFFALLPMTFILFPSRFNSLANMMMMKYAHIQGLFSLINK